ncbi:hypothetical protein MHYP_G00233940 [Metynnis hypsauchen]
MAPKRKADSSDGSASKKRKAITMEVKLDIVKRSDKGETATNIGRSRGLSRSTVAMIIKDKDTSRDLNESESKGYTRGVGTSTLNGGLTAEFSIKEPQQACKNRNQNIPDK